MINTELGSYIIIQQTVPITRVLHDHISSTKLTIKLAVTPIESAKDSRQKAADGFSKIKSWIISVLSDIIVVKYDAPYVKFIEESDIDNNLMHCPEEPDDFLLSAVLFEKISAIVDGQLNVLYITLTTEDTDYTERVFTSALKDQVLPGIEYFERETLHKEPWWKRGTIETEEFSVEGVKDLESLRAALDEANNKFKNDVFVFEADFDTDEEDDEEAEIVTLDTWSKKDE